MKGLLGRKILVSGCENVFGRLTALKLANLGAEVHSPDLSTILTDDLYSSGKFPGEVDTVLFLSHPIALSNKQIGRAFINNHMSVLIKLLRQAARYSAHFIYASSAAVYGRHRYLPIDEEHPLEPILMYGAAKLAGEHFCRAAAMENGFFYSIIRYGDIYGPGSRSLGEPAVYLERAIINKPIIIRGSGEQVRSYVYIEDAVDSVIKVIYNKPSNQIVNIAGNEYISLWHLANIIKQHYNNKCHIKTKNNVLLDEIECCLDSGKARELLDFYPDVDLTTGLYKTYSWLLNEIKIT